MEIYDGPHRDLTTMVKDMLIHDYSMTLDDILYSLETDGLHSTRMAVATVRSNFRDDVRLLKKMGALPEDSFVTENRGPASGSGGFFPPTLK